MAAGNLVSDATRRLGDWLAAGNFKEGDRLPSERSIARELGIKYYALNRAMGWLIAEGRVGREGYRLSLAAAPKPARRLVFDLVVSRRTHHLANYRKAAANLGLDLVLHPWEAAEEVAAILRRLDSKDTAGVICAPPPESVTPASWIEAARELTRRGVPVVCTGGWTRPCELSSVTANVGHGIALGFSHLAGMGHREIALAAAPGVFDMGIGLDDCWKRLCARNHLDACGERVLLQPSWLATPEEVDALVGLLTDGPWRKVTGLVLLIGYNGAIQSLFDKLAGRGRRVPGVLSVVVVGNARALPATRPRATAVTFDMVLWFELACELLRREIRGQRRFGLPGDSSCVQLMPRLTPRDSTRALADGSPAGCGSAVSGPVDAPGPIPLLRPKDDGEWEHLVRRPYSLAARASLSERPRFLPVDLRPYVNRPLIFRRGWLGDIPLRCLAPGTREIHGVPFEILGGPRRVDCGAVVFQSMVNTTGNARKLPDRLVIPVSTPCEAVYILHGCGYAKPMQPFASYTFRCGHGVAEAVPVVSQGKPLREAGGAAGRPGESGLTANIQDWWPDFPHADFPRARMAPLLENDSASHVGRHVFLYTLEWLNPAPKRPLTHIEIQADPSVSTTLGVLAVTVVRPAAR